MDPSAKVKADILAKYDGEASELNNAEWLAAGGSARVPESKASHYFIDRKVTEALKLAGASASQEAKVLEIGCSFGHMTGLLAARFKDLTAVDLSADSVEVARKRLTHYGITNVSFVVDDAESLAKLPDEAFDLIFSFSTVRFCPDPQAAMTSIYRKLRRGGVAIVDFPNRRSPWHGAVKKFLGIAPHVHDTLYTRSQAVKLFEDAGFRIEGVKQFLFTTKRLPAILLPLFKAMDATFERVGPLCRLAGIIMVRGVKD
ncbi:MAG: methyltransferase domain-containing protein [Sedimentisphaerales bacterium]|nr:methyltransferase domain-containing protein [Sedimentisphaerales bacterium]